MKFALVHYLHPNFESVVQQVQEGGCAVTVVEDDARCGDDYQAIFHFGPTPNIPNAPEIQGALNVALLDTPGMAVSIIQDLCRRLGAA